MKWGVFSTGGVIYCGLAGRVPGWNRLWFLSNRNSRNRFSSLLLFQKHRTQLMSKSIPIIGPTHPFVGVSGALTLTSWNDDKEELRLLPLGGALWSFSYCWVEMNDSESIPGNTPKLHWGFDCNFTELYVNLWKSDIFMRIFPAMNMVCLFHLFNFCFIFLNKNLFLSF